jgi:hypothetical protein
MKRNPPSPGFEVIGSGSFATAYCKEGTVELIVKPEISVYHKREVETIYDLSRELLIISRQSAPPAAKKHIPDIKRRRIDIGVTDGYRVAEFVYSMPKYSDVFSTKNRHYIKIIQSHGDFSELPKGLSDALETIRGIGIRHNAAFDMHILNFSESESGHLIIRDPFYCKQDGFESIKISSLWPTDQYYWFGLSPVEIKDDYDDEDEYDD